ncbi:hypothetical protein TcG_03356 [Trypanosoma cruzi]|uniref:Ubiquitin-like domain-containing protein n=2 Tax=Trypanosoma cruzi TaxID=5693 RepID=V5BJG5_TRYCR|nr:hypothetical protein TCDM_05166 [Trypanosoma cruzi Dm28c]KAF8289938.1 hypothetical protein TcBrA4_0134470 [Trypanosoma cruzi]PBJ71452.1 hypothetical protein BCY84_16794 [Trypanosoma cruzi cruzi]PWU94665.1 hypothetical protein C4B63_25g245 [Trypanosoma cruzi]RNF20949.1 hypothetical protein TcG_03356 [Trypanosoma cruzi]
MASKSSEGGAPATKAVYGNSVKNGGGTGNRTHHPYARFGNNNNNKNNSRSSSNNHQQTESNNNGRMASSPMQLVVRKMQDDGEEGISSPLVNVQARYRLQSPTLSNRAGDALLSASPPYTWSSSSSFYGDVNQNWFATGQAPSTPIPVKQDNDGGVGMGGRGMPPFSGSYAPSGFSMPPALADSMSTPINDNVLRSPHQKVHIPLQHLGSPPSMLRGKEFTASPTLLPVTPPYPKDVQSIQISPTAMSGHGGMRGHPVVAERPQGRQSKTGPNASDGASTITGSSASALREDLSLCPNDVLCTLINDRKHQRKYAHTCRLFPCYHGHVVRHGKLFRHAPGQIAQSDALTSVKGTQKALPAEALASVNFSSISPNALNAYRIIVTHGDQSYEIFGDWQNVRVHTFKRYLHQVYKIPPTSQVLVRVDDGVPLEDELESVGHYGVKPDTIITLKRKEDDAAPRVPLDEL